MRRLAWRPIFMTTIILMLGCAERGAESVPATALLDDALRPLYREVSTGVPDEQLVGRNLDLLLDLRFCSENNLLFSDTRIIVGENTKYYFIKWIFKPSVVAPILGKRDGQCEVKGTVVEVRRGVTTSGMPHVVAELERVALQPPPAR